ncbi:unnamed protein product [Schistosoma margrebowiei]|uniref:Uncharacterized protein n=1 Tax=Schistosoma margrebowiei TaxID=48269 RepID=A0A183MPJ6_9TREM|nr:unnamed protein product [Schistosoma margrebowiei]
MWDTGRALQIAAEMRRYNLEVLGINETHWTQVGQQRLASGELLLYSGHGEENAQYTQIVALILSKRAQNALIGWEFHGARIIKVSFKTKKEGITINIQERRNKEAATNTSRTRAEKAKAPAEYTEANKQVKRSIRTDKRKYVEDLAMTAEKAAGEGNMRQLHGTTKKLAGNYRK